MQPIQEMQLVHGHLEDPALPSTSASQSLQRGGHQKCSSPKQPAQRTSRLRVPRSLIRPALPCRPLVHSVHNMYTAAPTQEPIATPRPDPHRHGSPHCHISRPSAPSTPFTARPNPHRHLPHPSALCRGDAPSPPASCARDGGAASRAGGRGRRAAFAALAVRHVTEPQRGLERNEEGLPGGQAGRGRQLRGGGKRRERGARYAWHKVSVLLVWASTCLHAAHAIEPLAWQGSVARDGAPQSRTRRLRGAEYHAHPRACSRLRGSPARAYGEAPPSLPKRAATDALTSAPAFLMRRAEMRASGDGPAVSWLARRSRISAASFRSFLSCAQPPQHRASRPRLSAAVAGSESRRRQTAHWQSHGTPHAARRTPHTT
jgi:hypothetical protein